MTGLFQQFWEMAHGQKWEQMIDLTLKLGEINDREHNKGSKAYPQNHVILHCIMSSIPLKHECLSIILIWSLFLISSSGLLKSKKKYFSELGFQKWYWEKKTAIVDWSGAEIWPLEKGRKFPG